MERGKKVGGRGGDFDIESYTVVRATDMDVILLRVSGEFSQKVKKGVLLQLVNADKILYNRTV